MVSIPENTTALHGEHLNHPRTIANDKKVSRLVLGGAEPAL